jgi:hypothetical protein
LFWWLVRDLIPNHSERLAEVKPEKKVKKIFFIINEKYLESGMYEHFFNCSSDNSRILLSKTRNFSPRITCGCAKLLSIMPG